jgi:hypothetical protein
VTHQHGGALLGGKVLWWGPPPFEGSLLKEQEKTAQGGSIAQGPGVEALGWASELESFLAL